MKRIYLSDITMKRPSQGNDFTLSFREKLELCKLLDKLGIDSIETDAIENRRTDGLLIKSLCSAVKQAQLTVPVPAGDPESLVRAVQRLEAMSVPERETMGQRGKQWVLDRCEFSKLAKAFLEVMEEQKEEGLPG